MITKVSYLFGSMLLVGLLLCTGCASSDDEDQSKKGTVTTKKLTTVTVHSYVSAFGTGMMNSHIIETEKTLIILEMQKHEPYISEFSSYVKSLKKPVSRIYISHTCDCHLGYCDIVEGVPVYALPQVKDSLAKNKDKILDGLKKEFGDKAPSRIVVPTNAITVAQETVDGVAMKYTAVSGGLILYIEFPQEKMVSTQHLMYNKLHLPRLTSDSWKTPVDGFVKAGCEYYVAGHGVPGGKEVPEKFAQYQDFAKKTVNEKKTAQEAIQAIQEKYPDYDGVDLLTMIVTDFFKK